LRRCPSDHHGADRRRPPAVPPAGSRAARPFPELTDREIGILQLIADGYSNLDIARRLHLAGKTVRNHVSNVFAKLQVSDRPQAIVRARQAGLGTRAPGQAPRLRSVVKRGNLDQAVQVPRAPVRTGNEKAAEEPTGVLASAGTGFSAPEHPGNIVRTREQLSRLTSRTDPHHCTDGGRPGLGNRGGKTPETRKILPGNTENNERNRGIFR
jgi:DNA-binding CsgD family transcriptional regulator